MDEPRPNAPEELPPLVDEHAGEVLAEAVPVAASAPVATSWAAKAAASSGVPWITHLQFAAVALTIAFYIITFIFQAFRIPSGSMEDTLLVGDYLLVDKARFAPSGWLPLLPYRAVRRGDIVVFRYPVDPAQHFVKRVIGLPGDRIRLQRGTVFVNGRALVEPYVVFKEHYGDQFRDNFPRGNWTNENITVAWSARMHALVHDGELTVPAGEYFMMGDNRDQSLDSRYWGCVPRANIIGRPMFLYLSLNSGERDDDDDAASSGPQDGKLSTSRSRIFHIFGEVRWRRILRLAP